jgi:hypothetical protein
MMFNGNHAEQEKYKKWYDYFEFHLTQIYGIFIDRMKKRRIMYRDYSYASFCFFIYNNSSKRIPRY